MAKSAAQTIYDVLGRDPVHPFPARMAPDIALQELKSSKQLRVLDPMMGSGTVVAIARSYGHQAFGIDIDPLSYLIAKVWTTAVDHSKAIDVADRVLANAKNKFDRITVANAYPRSADANTQRFVRYWFDPYVRRQLAALCDAISRIQDDAIRDVLWCAFSRLIITKQSGASLALDLSHSRPHKSFEYAPLKPFNKFSESAHRVVENCISASASERGPHPHLFNCDAREAPLGNASVDLVLTSPPYLNAIDYIRCSKFSLVWMGHRVDSLRELRAESIGSEVGISDLQDEPEVQALIDGLKLRPKLQGRYEAILARYVRDMRTAIGEAARVVAPQGKVIYVVGENRHVRRAQGQ